MSWATVGVGAGVEQGVRGRGWHLQMGRQIMKLLGEWAAPGLAKLQKNDKRPKAESATPPSPPPNVSTLRLLLRSALVSDSHGTARGVAKVLRLERLNKGKRGLYTVVGGASSVSGAPCRLLFPKVFLFSCARPATTPATRGETRAGNLRHCQRHFVCFIIFYYHQVFVPSLSACFRCCSFTLRQAKLAVKMY